MIVTKGEIPPQTTELYPHPLAEIFPPISNGDFTLLSKDIKDVGVCVPIVLYEGMILDGRNRYRAAMEQEVACPVVAYEGDDPLGFVLSQNLYRRHLSESQRAMLASDIEPMFIEMAEKRRLANLKQNQDSGIDEDPELPEQITKRGRSRDKAAAMMNISSRSVANAKKVQHDGVPELTKQVRQNKIAVSTGARIAGFDTEFQDEILARIAAGAEPSQAITETFQDHLPVDPAPVYKTLIVRPPAQLTVHELEDIELSADIDCCVYLWLDSKTSPYVCRLMAHWGFQYQFCLFYGHQAVGVGTRGNIRLPYNPEYYIDEQAFMYHVGMASPAPSYCVFGEIYGGHI